MAYILEQQQLAHAANIQNCVRSSSARGDEQELIATLSVADGSGLLTLVATGPGQQVLVRTEIPLKGVDGEGESCSFKIRERAFATSVARLPSGDVRLTVDIDRGQLVVTDDKKRTKFAFRIVPVETNATIPTPPSAGNAVRWSLKVKDVIDLIQGTIYALSRQQSVRAQVTSVNLVTETGNPIASCYGTDGFRLASSYAELVSNTGTDDSNGGIDALLPRTSAA